MAEQLKAEQQGDGYYESLYTYLAGGFASIMFTYGYRRHEDYDIEFGECYHEPIFIFKRDILPVKIFSKIAEWVDSFGLGEKLYIIKDSSNSDRPAIDNNYITLMIRQ